MKSRLLSLLRKLTVFTSVASSTNNKLSQEWRNIFHHSTGKETLSARSFISDNISESSTKPFASRFSAAVRVRPCSCESSKVCSLSSTPFGRRICRRERGTSILTNAFRAIQTTPYVILTRRSPLGFRQTSPCHVFDDVAETIEFPQCRVNIWRNANAAEFREYDRRREDLMLRH